MSFVFYGMKTTGPNAAFDQIYDFGAVLTDINLKEIDHFQANCRLLPHVLPSPATVDEHRINISELCKADIPSHYEMVRKIRSKLLEWSPSNFIGYNSIDSGDHFLRQALFQTLHSPYLTNSDGNTRSDVLRIIRAAAIFAPGALIIPRREDGTYCFECQQVATSNGIGLPSTSKSLVELEMVLELSRMLSEKLPEIWSMAMRFSKKASVSDFIETEIVFSFSDFLYDKPFSWLVTNIGRSETNGAEYYVFNLAVEPKALANMREAELASRVQTTPKPVRVIRCNAAPILMNAAEAPATAYGFDLEIEELEARAEFLKSDREFCCRLISAFQNTKEQRSPSHQVEEQIYDRFTPKEDQPLLVDFHRVPWEKRHSILRKLNDSRLHELGQRLIHAERPKVLNADVVRAQDRAIAGRLLGVMPVDISARITLQVAIEESDRLLKHGAKNPTLLKAYRRYLVGRLEETQSVFDTMEQPQFRH